MTPKAALNFQTAIHKATQVGINNMWNVMNTVHHALISPTMKWEHRLAEEAITAWKADAERKEREISADSEARIVAGTDRNHSHGCISDLITNGALWNTR